jgi:membrane-bound inhibitor of C-type lysozyme
MKRFCIATLAALAATPALAQAANVEVAPAMPEPAPPAVSSALTITLGTTGDFERKTVHYGCTGDQDAISVDYINAAPNYLALLPLDGATLVFNTVLAASGAKYAAGKYVWWTKGDTASLYDLTQGENAKPILTCNEVAETP